MTDAASTPAMRMPVSEPFALKPKPTLTSSMVLPRPASASVSGPSASGSSFMATSSWPETDWTSRSSPPRVVGNSASSSGSPTKLKSVGSGSGVGIGMPARCPSAVAPSDWIASAWSIPSPGVPTIWSVRRPSSMPMNRSVLSFDSAASRSPTVTSVMSGKNDL